MLEIQVGGVDGRAHQLSEHALEVVGDEATGCQQTTFDLRDQGIHEISSQVEKIRL